MAGAAVTVIPTLTSARNIAAASQAGRKPEIASGTLLSRRLNLTLACDQAEHTWRTSPVIRSLNRQPVTFSPAGGPASGASLNDVAPPRRRAWRGNAGEAGTSIKHEQRHAHYAVFGPCIAEIG